MAYSYDLRTKALDYIEKGGSKVQASKIFGLTVQTLLNWVKRKKRGNLAPNKTRTRNSQKIDSEKLKTYIEKHPDSYLREIAEEFQVTFTAIFYACKRLKITLKKRRHSIRKEMRNKEKSFEKN